MAAWHSFSWLPYAMPWHGITWGNGLRLLQLFSEIRMPGGCMKESWLEWLYLYSSTVTVLECLLCLTLHIRMPRSLTVLAGVTIWCGAPATSSHDARWPPNCFCRGQRPGWPYFQTPFCLSRASRRSLNIQINIRSDLPLLGGQSRAGGASRTLSLFG